MKVTNIIVPSWCQNIAILQSTNTNNDLSLASDLCTVQWCAYVDHVQQCQMKPMQQYAQNASNSPYDSSTIRGPCGLCYSTHCYTYGPDYSSIKRLPHPCKRPGHAWSDSAAGEDCSEGGSCFVPFNIKIPTWFSRDRTEPRLQTRQSAALRHRSLRHCIARNDTRFVRFYTRPPSSRPNPLLRLVRNPLIHRLTSFCSIGISNKLSRLQNCTE